MPESWIFEKDESFKKCFIFVGILTGKGTIPLIRLPSEVKINAQFYVDYVLKPLFTEHLPKLYRNEMDKVFFHHDKASSHTSHVKLFPKKKILANVTRFSTLCIVLIYDFHYDQQTYINY